jgi:hypothetical protein
LISHCVGHAVSDINQATFAVGQEGDLEATVTDPSL